MYISVLRNISIAECVERTVRGDSELTYIPFHVGSDPTFGTKFFKTRVTIELQGFLLLWGIYVSGADVIRLLILHSAMT